MSEQVSRITRVWSGWGRPGRKLGKFIEIKIHCVHCKFIDVVSCDKKTYFKKY